METERKWKWYTYTYIYLNYNVVELLHAFDTVYNFVTTCNSYQKKGKQTTQDYDLWFNQVQV